MLGRNVGLGSAVTATGTRVASPAAGLEELQDHWQMCHQEHWDRSRAQAAPEAHPEWHPAHVEEPADPEGTHGRRGRQRTEEGHRRDRGGLGL